MHNKKSSTLSLFVYNSVEDEWKFYQQMQDIAFREKSIIGSNRFSDCYIFAMSDVPNCVYISPRPIHIDFLKYFTSLTGLKMISKVPKKNSEFICRNVIQDTKLLSWIIKRAQKNNQSITIYSYANSPYLYELKEAIESHHIQVLLPDAPLKKHIEMVSYFGSKTGFRKAFHSHMPFGYICKSPLEAAQKASLLYRKNNGVVIKTEKGNAGEGVLIYRKGDLPLHKNECEAFILNRFKKDSYWYSSQIVVEKYIDSSKEKKQPFPSIEGYIKQDGTITLPYYCNMIVTKEGEFYGMEMAKNTLAPKVAKQVQKISYHIATTYAKNGLRGRFDIDFIYDGNKLYANESNVRCNGGTDTYFIVKKLIGVDFFTNRYVLAKYIDLTIKGRKTLKKVLKILKPLLFSKKKRLVIVINSEAVIRHKGLSYITIAASKKEAFIVDQKINNLIQKYS
ncbi:MAG: hypothetical protein NTZ55_05570 [Candidatus Roizmanbacteria bacterium]|nr:hypothetical protein [Candidatus Roizmanbacteria bacterium]